MATLAEIDAEIARRSQPSLVDIDAEIARRTPEPSLLDASDIELGTGLIETGTTIATAAAAEPISGIAGLVTGGLTAIGNLASDITGVTRSPAEAAAEAVGATQEALTFQPRTEAGQQILGNVGEVLAPIGEAIESVETSLGESTLETTGSPGAAALAATVPTAALLAIGGFIPKVTKSFSTQSKTKQKIAKLIEEGSTDKDTAGFKLAKKIDKEIPRVQKDQLALDTIKQGFDEGVIAAVKGSSGADKQKMIKMVGIMQRGKQNARFATTNRPSDVLGDSLMDRVRIILGANKNAGDSIDGVAESLKGQPVDISSSAKSFAQGLDDLGVTLVSDKKGGFKPDFEFSDLGPGDRGPLKEVIRQINIKGASGEIDGLTAHKLKRAIDNNVTFGKSKTGMSGDAERLLKSFRTDIDDALDTTFPEYNRVNVAYSETIKALDSLQASVGQKLDLRGPNADKATGTALRRLLSNAQGRVNLLDSLNEVESTAKKFAGFRGELDPRAIEGPKADIFKDDLLNQVLFVDELDKVFKPLARTSFQGQISQAIDGSLDVTQMTAAGMSLAAAKALVKKQRKINEKEGFKAIDKLLKQ